MKITDFLEPPIPFNFLMIKGTKNSFPVNKLSKKELRQIMKIYEQKYPSSPQA